MYNKDEDMKDYVTSILLPKNAEWRSPKILMMDIDNDDGTMAYELLKGAESYIHKQVGIKNTTSKDLYKLSENIWNELRDLQLEKCNDRPRMEENFDLTKSTVLYLSNSHKEIVDVMDVMYEDRLEQFKHKHQEFMLNLTTNRVAKQMFMSHGNFFKFVCWDKNIDYITTKYIPVVFVEMNYDKSTYESYSGILVSNKVAGERVFIYVPSTSCDISDDSLYSFINRFNMEEALIRSTEKADELIEAYERFVANPIEISVRELTTLLRKVGYEIKPDDADNLAPIKDLIDEESKLQVENFYNTFRFVTGENVYDIMQLSDFRKTFRYNKLTILDVLGILSKEYMTYTGVKITAKILGDIVYKLYDTNSVDKSQVAIIEKEQK